MKQGQATTSRMGSTKTEPISKGVNVTTGSQNGLGAGNSQFGIGGTTIAMTTSAVNTTVATELTITGTLGNGGDTFTLAGYAVEVIIP